MKFFIDTANLNEIKEAYDLGVLDGVTTNPSLMANEGISGDENVINHYKAICNIVDANVSAEVIATDFEGASYLSPFIGRLDDISFDGLDLIAQIVHIYQNYGYETEVLAASVRHTMHLVKCAELGADVVTCPLKVITGLLNHPLTDKGLAQFLADHAKANK